MSVLVKHFIEKHAHKRKDLLIKDIGEDAMHILKTYSYPGNIRELENVIERAVSFADSPQILPSDLPAGISQFPSQKVSPSLKLKETLRNVEKELIWSSLQKSGGNISRAASELGIHRQQLQRKLRSLKIET
jgi:transcriptional regulator with PAS, ATPase and Fis domain